LSISALIEDRFIEENTKESIESFFEKYHIYHKIEGIKDQVLPIGDGILLWPNDENCQRLNRY
jgi:hypothetical protein